MSLMPLYVLMLSVSEGPGLRPILQDVSSHGLSVEQKGVNDQAREKAWALLTKHISPHISRTPGDVPNISG